MSHAGFHQDWYERFKDEPRTGRGAVQLRAMEKNYRVVGCDTFEAPVGPDWIYAEYDSLEEARECAVAHGSPMTSVYTHDREGNRHFPAGSF